MKGLKKFAALCAASLVLAAGACFAAEVSDTVSGVWGIDFGASVEEADRIMVGENKATRVVQYSYQPNYSEALYQVDFFGRQGHMLLRFSRKGMFLARFSFLRRDTLPSERAQQDAASQSRVIDARQNLGSAPAASMPAAAELSRNYSELRSMLVKKYGTPSSEFKSDGKPVGCVWSGGSFGRRSVTLYENRSMTRNDTVLSYEDDSKK